MSEFEAAYKDLLNKNTQLNAENQMLKQQMQQTVDKLASNVKILDERNGKLEAGIVKALRKSNMTDVAIVEWIGNNNIPLSLRIVPDTEDAFGKGESQ